MAVIRIHNEDWGFETNCFVCEPRNDRGLRIAGGRRWAVTTETSTTFHRAVYVGKHYRVEAEVVDRADPSAEPSDDETTGTMRCAARVLDRHDQVRAEATATFTTLGEAQAARMGAVVDESNRAYVEGGASAD
jgi:acyl-coenzyme A thioesterase PaaI-like protein